MRLPLLLTPILLASALFAASSAAIGQPVAGPAPDPAAYMAGVARQPGIVVTPSGLAYKVVKSGPVSGAHPRLGDPVRVAYTGKLTDGTVFDSSDNAGGPLTMIVGQLVPGWNEALQLMRPGDEWTLYLPPSLGYGDRATGPIPADSVMVFDLQLLATAPAGG